MRTHICLAAAAALVILPPSVEACDLHAIYTAFESRKLEAGSWHLGVAEQYTAYDELRDEGGRIDNVANQFLRSSTTQFLVSRDISDTVALQLNLPLHYRAYRRIEDGSVAPGHESGLGDLVLSTRWRPIERFNGDTSLRLELLAGIKLPTGDSDRLREELGEHHGDDDIGDGGHGDHGDHTEEGDHTDHGGHADHAMEDGHMLPHLRHGGEDHGDDLVSAVHGHDLALGSGSVDFPLGLSFLARRDRLFGTAMVQYVIRTSGSYDYRYASDLAWETGVGAYVALADDYSVAAKVNVSGEYKPKDALDGNDLSDTYRRTVYVGPELLVSVGDTLAGELGLDVPVDTEVKDVMVTQTIRARAALTWRF